MRTNNDVIASAAVKVGHVVNIAGVDTLGGMALTSYAPIYKYARVPGVAFRMLVADESGDIDTDINSAFIDQLRGLWVSRIAPAGFFTADQLATVKKLLGVGVVVVPANATAIHNYDPNHDSDLFTPSTASKSPQATAAWNSLCAEMNAFAGLYLNKQVEACKLKGEQLAADAAFWDTINKSVADFPANVITFGLKAYLPYIIAIVVIGAIGLAIYSKGMGAVAKIIPVPK